jgi:hypothetical protein
MRNVNMEVIISQHSDSSFVEKYAMKINLINLDYTTLYQKSCIIIRSMQYIIQNDSMNTGMISAFSNNGHSKIIDIKFSRSGNQVSLTIFSGLFSSDFVTINYDESTALLFVEKLYHSLNTEIDTNGFRLNEEDYISALI